ncbi:MAG: ATP-binding cassette domain-containing protein [Bacteroidota bacterium]|jgi:ABC-type multidrug transport system ATPase subunit
MYIQLEQIGKKYNREWIFRGLSYTFQAGKKYAITGPNGAGKSTLLQTIAGSTVLSEGSIKYSIDGQEILPENAFTSLSICAPYLTLIEEMTALEFLAFHESFKCFMPGITPDTALEIIGLMTAANKQIRYFSSGMKQRIKLAQAIFSDVPVLFLDEPCTNLDETGYALYQSLIQNYASHKLIIVSSNDKAEYHFCEEVIDIKNYK